MKAATPQVWQTSFYLPSTYHSELFAQSLARCVIAPMVMTFSGDIGTGKTTIIRALLRAMGVSCRIKSPTFSLVETYDLASFQCHHFDLYRIVDESELEFLGFREYFQPNSFCCIEWPERVTMNDAQVDIALSIQHTGEGRTLSLLVKGKATATVSQCLQDFAKTGYQASSIYNSL